MTKPVEDEREAAMLLVNTTEPVPRSMFLAKMFEIIELIRDGGDNQGVLGGKPNTVWMLAFKDDEGNLLK